MRPLVRPLSRVSRAIACLCELAKLERADVRDDRPAVFDRDLVLHPLHEAAWRAVRDHVEDVAGRELPDMVEVEIPRVELTDCADDAVAIAGLPVARRAVDLESPLPTCRERLEVPELLWERLEIVLSRLKLSHKVSQSVCGRVAGPKLIRAA